MGDDYFLKKKKTKVYSFLKINFQNQKIENVVVDILKSPDWIFFLLQEMNEKKQKSLKIFLIFLFSYRLRGLGYFRFRKLDVFAIFNQSDCGFKKKCSDIFL